MALALTLSPVSARASWQSNGPLDRSFIQETVRSLAAVVEREYFDLDLAGRVDETLRARLDDGHYFDANDLESLAAMLTAELYELTSDKHIAVSIAQPKSGSPTAEVNNDSRHVRGRRSNWGVEHLQILSGNVGYLNVTYFFRPDEARDAITSAMQSLRHADALIVDMRGNAGGSPGTVALIASYFFDAAGLPLFEIVPRYDSKDGLYSTADPAVPNRDGVRPLYILTSERTFSAGEGLAFLIQERQRGEIVGERTAGAANPGRAYPLNPRLEVIVPNGQVRMAITGRNWEGLGVTPDIAVPATDALRAAHVRALRSLLSATPKGSWADSLRKELEKLEAENREQ